MSTISFLIVGSLSIVSAFVPVPNSFGLVTPPIDINIKVLNVNKALKLKKVTSLHETKSKEDTAAEKLIENNKMGRFNEPGINDEFCLIDTDNGKNILLTREEKERIFLDSIQSYYFEGKNGLSDIQFDKLRSDLSWEGSALVNLNRNETLFMNACQAYNKGKPIINDLEFDDLKMSLRMSNSKIAVADKPKCYVDTGVCKVTWSPDTLRTGSLYVPASLISTLLYIGLSYEIPGLFDIHFNPLLLLAVGFAPLTAVTKQVTENFFFNDPSVAIGPCPTCSAENKVFFGSVVGIDGDNDESAVKCTSCKTPMTVKRETLRVSTLMKKAAPPAKVYDGKKPAVVEKEE
mmetsp:Transcript_489/g.546  ORF Transcript_489/g.546 Transcript_489/m.546 type:complete len:347 (-) Transcript_489:446-1486(-)|eukprot:CAMPEP_0119033138 /NCGR_PEP_ID=MMETSP1177-20130426/137_1 /TAXON_ID=2985 /ORGANISM="Ochromonas sp, Strain CCMP1899" /LENGTH=346 /DNA_ID=CAMNT_0006989635 /DNA_START=159 /DNA_END=1199 /DNA_ORIENTATION=-